MARVPGVLDIDGDAVGDLRYRWSRGGNVLGGVLELASMFHGAGERGGSASLPVLSC